MTVALTNPLGPAGLTPAEPTQLSNSDRVEDEYMERILHGLQLLRTEIAPQLKVLSGMPSCIRTHYLSRRPLLRRIAALTEAIYQEMRNASVPEVPGL